MFFPYKDSNQSWKSSANIRIPLDSEWIIMPILLQEPSSSLKLTKAEHWILLARQRQQLTPSSFHHYFYIFDSFPCSSTANRIQQKVERATGFHRGYKVTDTSWHSIQCTRQKRVECGARLCANIQILLHTIMYQSIIPPHLPAEDFQQFPTDNFHNESRNWLQEYIQSASILPFPLPIINTLPQINAPIHHYTTSTSFPIDDNLHSSLQKIPKLLSFTSGNK